jgi:hypothetical protein
VQPPALPCSLLTGWHFQPTNIKHPELNLVAFSFNCQLVKGREGAAVIGRQSRGA